MPGWAEISHNKPSILLYVIIFIFLHAIFPYVILIRSTPIYSTLISSFLTHAILIYSILIPNPTVRYTF